MKNFKRFTAVIASSLIFCISVFSSSFRVSADSALDYFSSGSVYGSLPDDFPTFVNDSVSSLLSCQDFTADNYYIVCYYYNNQSFIGVFDSTWFNSLNGYNFSYDPSTRELHGFSVLSDYSLFYEPGFTIDSSLVSSVTYILVTDSSNNFYISHYITSTSIEIDYQITDYIVFSPGCFSAKPVDPDQPSSSIHPLYGVKVGIDKKGFLEWLITEGKESVINSTGFNFTQKQLSLLVDVFDSYGNSSFWFYSSLVKTFKLTQHSLTGASALLSTLQELYRDYLDYKNSIEIVEITPDTNAKPHWRQDKTDNTLVTDHEDDTSVVSILREILRTIIYLPSSIRTSFSDLATNIVSIMYNWNRLFDKLDYISPDISGDVDRLIDAINNISVDVPDTSVDVTITDEKQQELDDFFNGWSVDFDNKVKEKFPVTAQLGELFNDDFFEKCGIDCNGDGEVYSYYSENVYAVSEVSTVSELSASAPCSDQKLVSDFIGQFDSADVNFLNDANFSSSVPDWSITVGGKKCEVFSFKLYAKYRTQIHFIISFILWTVYLLSLYKSLPSIIGQVSDVVHGIEKM